jgi:hypothetical protein
MKRSGFSQVLSKFSKDREGGRFCPITLADFHICGGTENRVARVTLITDVRDYSSEEIETAFISAMDRRARLFPKSVVRAAGSRNGKNFYSALAMLNRQSIPYKDNVEKMTVLSSSTFLDDKEQIWRVEGDGDQRRLYINAEDDMAAIFQARRQHHLLPETASDNNIPNGNYCMYYSPKDGNYSFGFAFNSQRGLTIVDRKQETATVIDPALVVASDVLDVRAADDSAAAIRYEAPYGEVAASSAQKIIDYYRKIFKNTAFFVKLEAAIRQSAK